jgi:hypothetical protein
MPEWRKNEGSRSSRKILNARKAEKRELKVIEKDSQCPKGRKKGAQGHRERFSMPVWQKKEGPR